MASGAVLLPDTTPRARTGPAAGEREVGPRGRIAAVLLVLLGTAAGCAGGRPPAPEPLPGPAPAAAGKSEEGIASWYGRPYHGRPTASGEIYDMRSLTAAHRTLPFGTRVEVTRVDNGRQVVVRINDRGPFAPGRILDLSRAAAEKLDMLQDGVARVRIRVLEASS